jgi:hypothetical protein
VETSKRKKQVSFPTAFVWNSNSTPPLARLIQGGQGGEVRLKLYLTITLMATSRPYDISMPPTPHSWVQLLDLPRATGARRISANLKWLEENSYIRSRPRRGAPARIVLLNADGSGKQYTRPMPKERYVGLPLDLWKHGWLLELSPTGLAVLIALLDLRGAFGERAYLTHERRESYGLSPDTWTRARKELERFELLTVTRTPLGDYFNYQRMRNLYQLHPERLETYPSTLRLQYRDRRSGQRL